MNADFLTVLEFWEREKGISRDILVAAVEEALLSAAKKAVGPARELRCVIDQKSGDIKAFAKLVVSEKVLSKHDQITVFDARRVSHAQDCFTATRGSRPSFPGNKLWRQLGIHPDHMSVSRYQSALGARRLQLRN